jgi:hypothetical protein
MDGASESSLNGAVWRAEELTADQWIHASGRIR